MTGFDLYRRLAAKDAAGAPRFLFISDDKTAVPADSDVAGVPMLSKPFTATDLETALVAAGIVRASRLISSRYAIDVTVA